MELLRDNRETLQAKNLIGIDNGIDSSITFAVKNDIIS